MGRYDAQEALVRKFFERRNVELFQGVRRERGVIANRMAADGNLNSGAFVGRVTEAFVQGFKAFGQGLTKDVFELVNRSSLTIDAEVAAWVRGQLEPFFQIAAKNLRVDAAEGRILPNELRESIDRAMDKAVAELTRDLEIELDLALVTVGKPIVDEALQDTLVPLQNRRGFETQFANRTKSKDEPTCIVLFDIDHFKDVNDQQGGHAVGDEALKSIAETAAACLQGKGNAFRFGGDEFVLLLPNHSLEEGLAVAERFRVAINSVQRTSKNLTLSVSVGVAVFPTDGADLDTVLKAADAALFDAKERGRGPREAAARRVAPAPAPTIKWVDLEYPQKSGLQARLNEQGFKLTWRRDDKPREDDAEPVTIDDGGSPAILRINSPDSALTLFQKRV